MQNVKRGFLGYSLVFLLTCALPGCGWNKTFGEAADDGARCVQTTADGGAIVAGYTTAAAGDTDALLIKLDLFGRPIWQKTFPAPGPGAANAVRQTAEGGYIVVGDSGANKGDVWVLKLSAAGEPEWERTLGGYWPDSAASVAVTASGEYLIGATTASAGAGETDAWIIKLNPDGTDVWAETFGGAGADSIQALVPTDDGGCIAAGSTQSTTPTPNAWIFRIDSAGRLVWSQAFEGGMSDSAAALDLTKDGGCIAAVNRETASGQDIWLIKLKGDRTWEWDTTVDLSMQDTAAGIQQTAEGGYVVSGSVSPDGIQRDILLLKTDSQGKYAWDKTFGGAADDAAASLCEVGPWGFVLAGTTRSSGAGQSDVSLIKTNPFGWAPAKPQ